MLHVWFLVVTLTGHPEAPAVTDLLSQLPEAPSVTDACSCPLPGAVPEAGRLLTKAFLGTTDISYFIDVGL